MHGLSQASMEEEQHIVVEDQQEGSDTGPFYK
jgi:hypothetical protein